MKWSGFPNGNTAPPDSFSFTYNTNGYVSKAILVRANVLITAFDLDYDASNRLVQIRTGNTVVRTFLYDNQSRIIRIVNNTSSIPVIEDLRYDASGRVIWIGLSVNNQYVASRSYRYVNAATVNVQHDTSKTSTTCLTCPLSANRIWAFAGHSTSNIRGTLRNYGKLPFNGNIDFASLMPRETGANAAPNAHAASENYFNSLGRTTIVPVTPPVTFTFENVNPRSNARNYLTSLVSTNTGEYFINYSYECNPQ